MVEWRSPHSPGAGHRRRRCGAHTASLDRQRGGGVPASGAGEQRARAGSVRPTHALSLREAYHLLLAILLLLVAHESTDAQRLDAPLLTLVTVGEDHLALQVRLRQQLILICGPLVQLVIVIVRRVVLLAALGLAIVVGLVHQDILRAHTLAMRSASPRLVSRHTTAYMRRRRAREKLADGAEKWETCARGSEARRRFYVRRRSRRSRPSASAWQSSRHRLRPAFS